MNLLAASGFVEASSEAQADVCVVNTCSVTDAADAKSRHAIRQLRRSNPRCFLVVIGCLAQLKPRETAAIDGVDLVLGTDEKFRLADYLFELFCVGGRPEGGIVRCATVRQAEEFHPACSKSGRTRVFLKVQDGCNYRCTYCTIPRARGRSRSGSIAETLSAARQAIGRGAKEIVLTGVNTGDFGRGRRETFLDLLRAFDELTEEVRIRISSVEPNLLSDEMIELIGRSPRLMPHFHLPLQSGCDEVLRIMGRRYDSQLFRRRVEAVKALMPEAFVGVDVMVGVRGERSEFFEKSYEFIRSLDVSQLHVFAYSEREGTQMLLMPGAVAMHERRRRSEQVRVLSILKLRAFYERQIGSRARVLWESRRGAGLMTGFTENYVKVQAPFRNAALNTVEEVVLGGWNEKKDALCAQPAAELSPV